MRPDWIDLDGTANTRDVGGLPTTDGRRTVSRRLIRSDNLQDLSRSDVRLLIEDYGVAAIADLRSELEVRAGEKLNVALNLDRIHVFDSASGLAYC